MGEPAGVDRGHEGLEIGLPGKVGIKSLQPLRGPEQERRRISAPSQGERDLRPHPLHVRRAELADRADLSHGQQGLRGPEITGGILRPRPPREPARRAPPGPG